MMTTTLNAAELLAGTTLGPWHAEQSGKYVCATNGMTICRMSNAALAAKDST